MKVSTVELLVRELHPKLMLRGRERAARLNSSSSEITAAVSAARQAKVLRVRDGIPHLLHAHDKAVVARQQQHAATSPYLNCWSVLGLEDSEISHSLVLAWLLDRRGSHAQGSLFLREILRSVLPSSSQVSNLAGERYRVATEVSHARSRIDIELIGQTFIIHIEVKVNAAEGEDQTCREREDLRAKAIARRIPAQRVLALYVTVDGQKCSDTELFKPISAAIAAGAAAFASCLRHCPGLGTSGLASLYSSCCAYRQH